MATTEKMGVITQIDESGNEIILYPKTKAEQVAGLEEKIADVKATIYRKNGNIDETVLQLNDLSDDERKIILAGSLINFYN